MTDKSKLKEQIRVDERHPVRWAKDWIRTPIGSREEKRIWKKPFAEYERGLVEQLRKFGATEILITWNQGDDARRDPGVTVYFSKPREQDYSWQGALGIESPLPTIAEIDEAFRKKAAQHHPDREGGDVEIFRALAQHRDRAKAWILNKGDEHEYAIALDKFSEPRWNLNAIKLGIAALRRLDEYGLPGMLERAFKGFRTAIEAPKEENDGKRATITA